MNGSNDLATAVRQRVAPDGVWVLPDTTLEILHKCLRRLPKENVSEDERRYPTTPAGLRAFLDAFFARHYFQVQDTILEHFSSPTFTSALKRGTLHIADVGSGPAVVPLAIADMVSAVLTAMDEPRSTNRRGSFRIDLLLNDVSEICLTGARLLLDEYRRRVASPVSIGRVLTVATSFPRSVAHFHRVARITGPYDICSIAYLLDRLWDQVGTRATVGAIRKLTYSAHQDCGQLVIIQDKFRVRLHRRVCGKLGVPAEMGKLKQHVYDSENEHQEHSYTYCRTCSPVSAVSGADDSMTASGFHQSERR